MAYNITQRFVTPTGAKRRTKKTANLPHLPTELVDLLPSGMRKHAVSVIVHDDSMGYTIPRRGWSGGSMTSAAHFEATVINGQVTRTEYARHNLPAHHEPGDQWSQRHQGEPVPWKVTAMPEPATYRVWREDSIFQGKDMAPTFHIPRALLAPMGIKIGDGILGPTLYGRGFSREWNADFQEESAE